jgi:nucleotide-binding universal stress UspA family protein
MFGQHPYGVAVTIIAIVLLTALIWSLRRKPQLPADIAEARASVSGLRRILVPVRGFPHEERAVELACRLGQEQKSQIVLVSIIEVPLTLSLGSDMPDEEQHAQEAVSRGVELVKAHKLEPVTRIERDRSAGRGILRVAADMSADLVVLGLDPARSIAGDPVGQTAETLLRKANFEVIFDRPAPPSLD